MMERLEGMGEGEGGGSRVSSSQTEVKLNQFWGINYVISEAAPREMGNLWPQATGNESMTTIVPMDMGPPPSREQSD